MAHESSWTPTPVEVLPRPLACVSIGESIEMPLNMGLITFREIVFEEKTIRIQILNLLNEYISIDRRSYIPVTLGEITDAEVDTETIETLSDFEPKILNPLARLISVIREILKPYGEQQVTNAITQLLMDTRLSELVRGASSYIFAGEIQGYTHGIHTKLGNQSSINTKSGDIQITPITATPGGELFISIELQQPLLVAS